jgi:hypothetical protein
MAVATAMPAVVTSDKVAMTAVASAAMGECSWSDRQHSGKDQSDNLDSAHYTNSFFPQPSGRSSWNDNRICRFSIS